MTKTSPSVFRLQTSDFRLHFRLRFYFVLLRKMFWSSEDRVRARFHYAESRQNKPQVNLGGNLHVKSKDLNGPEIYLIILLSS